MKNLFLSINLFFLCLILGFSAHAKDVGGPIIEDAVWTIAESPFIVKSHVTVIEDVTLTIEPGVTVKFDKDKALLIDGTLVAKGTDAEKIIFTSNGDQVAGYWGFISFSDISKDATFDPSGNYTGGCILQFAAIQWGGSVKPAVTINLSSPFIADSLIANNYGNAISIAKGSPIISGCEVKNNSGIGIYSGGDGSTTLTVKNTKTLNNSSTGIYAENNSNVNLQNCTVSGNTNMGIYLNGNATISDCAISGNSAGSGGGIYASGTITIQNSTISGNSASSPSSNPYGGGIYASGTITIQNSTISGNSASSYHAPYGGGIYASGTITIHSSTIISGNSASYGGGIYASGSTATIQNSTISGNSAGVYGGGMKLDSGTYTIEGNTFTDNSANSGGGAINTDGTVAIRNNAFKKDKTETGNSAPVGGAIWAGGTVTIQGNEITGNTASTSFGGVVRLENLSGGSVVGGTSCQDANLIKDNNGDAVYISGSPAFNYNDVYNNTGFELINGSSATIDASNCYWGTTNEAVVKAEIWDGLDDPALGLVTYKPFLATPCKPDDTTPPSAVTDLATSSPTANSITLTWTAPGDDGNVGAAAQYDVRYSTSEITDANWDTATQCTGEPAPKEAGNREMFTVTDLKPNTTYYFVLKTADEVQNWSELSNVARGTTIPPSDKTPPATVTNLVIFTLTDAITLFWTAPGDDGNVGTATKYEIRYSIVSPFNWDTATDVKNPPNPHPAGTREEFTVTGLSPTYYFALKAVDKAGNWSNMSNIATGGATGGEVGKFIMNLAKGLNMVSLPLKPDSDMRAKEFAELLEATLVIQLNKETQQFEAFVPKFGWTNFPIEGGEGYIVNVLESKAVEFEGRAWFSAPDGGGGGREPLWAFVIGGEVGFGDWVLVRNARTGEVASGVVRDGRFAVVLGGIQGREVMREGDIVEVLAYDKGKLTGRGDMRVGIAQLERAVALVHIGRLPEKTTLLQNYPNPFNPETWIPFRLAENAEVMIIINDLKGRLVRELALGRLEAGVYEQRDKAAYWDGRNGQGEQVASGVYIYQMVAGKKTFTKRMVILK